MIRKFLITVAAYFVSLMMEIGNRKTEYRFPKNCNFNGKTVYRFPKILMMSPKLKTRVLDALEIGFV